ncbi:uncharacterized protein LOC116455732 isoform X1 [Corvus moneduloides]|uniref:uncharacterized protein LOC116455732 isoform X1 n=2 Tax=Corvus moneduloides TaxID=1196302 RepID=UPI0013620EEF|nr:uncharacterized protein LOC116455732 isoform X1 [Corvus moneduloides]
MAVTSEGAGDGRRRHGKVKLEARAASAVGPRRRHGCSGRLRGTHRPGEAAPWSPPPPRADTAGLSQTQGCHSADVQSVSQCSEDRAGVCLIQTAQFTSRSGRALTLVGTFTYRNHSVSSQFGV